MENSLKSRVFVVTAGSVPLEGFGHLI